MGAPVVSSARGDVAGLRPLSGDEIRRLLVGRTLSFVPDPGVPTSPHQEVYNADGTMFVRVDRAGSPGTYRILADRLCLTFGSGAEGSEECRSLFTAADGRHYFVVLDGAGAGWPIRISIDEPPVGGSRVTSPVAGLRPLSGEETRLLLVGRTLSHDVERALRQGLSAIMTPYRETFRPDGRVEVLHHRAGFSGRYEIAGDRLCLELTNRSRECRHLYRAADGGLLQQDASNPGGEVTPITIVDPERSHPVAQRFEQLRGERLAAAIRGRMIVPRRAPIETPSSERFNANGTYVLHSDRIQSHGTYEIMHDRYCAVVGSTRRCSSLHRDGEGNYYVRPASPVASGYIAVLLTD